MTGLAIMLAAAAAVVFGVAAVNQHRGVRATVAPQQQRLTVGQLGRLIADPGWRRGFALMALGTGLHIAALSLAPISLTQPLNVLAVPTTIIATAVISRRRPRPTVLLAATAVVGGVAAFVTALSDASAGQLPPAALLVAVAVGIATTTALLHLAARLLTTTGAPTWLAPVLLGLAAALNFGTASSIFRLLAQGLGGSSALTPPMLAGLAVAVPIAMAAGAWSQHQAYAAGAASAVTAASALADPVVAITLGMAVLGETHALTTTRLLAMLAAAGAAALGVIHLARHDDSDSTPSGEAPRAPAVAPRSPLTSTRNPYAHLARR